MMIRMVLIHSKVFAAFLGFGSLNAEMPFEIASMGYLSPEQFEQQFQP